MPKSFKAKESLNTSKRKADDIPRAGDPFVEGCTWAEFKNDPTARNPHQAKIELAKENQVWHYLGKTSTEARAQFTEDPTKPRHNPKGHFLDTIPKPVNTVPRQSYAASYPTNINQNALNASKGSIRPPPPAVLRKDEKPYMYKPRIPNTNEAYRVDPQAYLSQQSFLQAATPTQTPNHQSPSLAFGTDPRWRPAASSPNAQYTPAPPPILPGATVATYSKYSGYPTSGTAPSQSRPQHLQVSQQDANTQPVAHQQSRPNMPSQKQFQLQPQQQPPRSQAPPQSRAVLAPPAPYRPGYTPPALQPPRQNPFSASRPSSSKTNPFAKYAYLQKEHNRSPLDYKSPYRPGGGFMNGYEGNLKMHLEQKMFKTHQGSWNEAAPSGQSAAPTNQRIYSTSQSPTGYTQASQSPSYGPQAASSSQQQSVLQPHQITKATVDQDWAKKDTSQYHPAIRQEYTNSMKHNQYPVPPRPTPSQYTAASPQPAQGQMSYEAPLPQQFQYQQPQRTQQHYQAHSSPVLQPPQQVYRTHQTSPPLKSPQYFQPYQPHQYPAKSSPNTGTPVSILAPPGQAPMQYHQHQIPHQNAYRETKLTYAHQQPLHKSSLQGSAQSPTQFQPPLASIRTQSEFTTTKFSQPGSSAPTHTVPSQPSHTRDFPDVPADSTSIIEQMLANLKKARPTSSSSATS